MSEPENPIACGGVLVNARRQVLLRQPAGCFDGYAWTFPKGRPEPGETHEQAALREVLEETGWEARVIKRIPGEFQGGSTRSIYFLMEPAQKIQEPDRETAEVKWVDIWNADSMIHETKNVIGRLRDERVLRAARNVLQGKESPSKTNPETKPRDSCRGETANLSGYEASFHAVNMVKQHVSAEVNLEAESNTHASALAGAAWKYLGPNLFEQRFGGTCKVFDEHECGPVNITPPEAIERLPVSVAELLILDKYEIFEHDRNSNLNLKGLKEMPRDLARTLAHHEGTMTLSPAIEKEFRGHVTLTAQEIIDAIDANENYAYASACIRNDNPDWEMWDSPMDVSCFWYMEDEAARLLTHWECAELNSLREISDGAAKIFGNLGEFHLTLCLPQLKKLSEKAARELCRENNPLHLEICTVSLPEPARSIVEEYKNKKAKDEQS